MIERPTQIKIVGDQGLGRQFIGPAKSQMNILRNQMRFQKLNQGSRRLWLQPNIHVECLNIYGSEVCIIRAIRKVDKEVIELATTTTVLLIVFGNSEQILNLSNVDGVFEIDEAVSGGSCSGTITSVGAPSGVTQTIYGSFTDCTSSGVSITGSVSAASGIIDSYKDRYFQKAYEYYELTEKLPTLDVPTEKYELTSALDTFPPSSIPDGFNITIDQEWSKTLNKFMVSAFTHYSDYKYEMLWTVSASFENKEVSWKGSKKFFGKFKRAVLRYTLSYESAVKTHIGFDLWQDDAGDYFVGVMSDQEEILSVFKLDQDENNLVLQNEYSSTVRKDKYLVITELPENYHRFNLGDDLYKTENDIYTEDANIYKLIRLIGYGYDQGNDQHIAYWGELFDNFYPGKSNHYSFLFYCKEILNTGEITLHFLPSVFDNYPGYFHGDIKELPRLYSALWNPITRSLKTKYSIGVFSHSYDYLEFVQNGSDTGRYLFDYGSLFIGDYEIQRGSQEINTSASWGDYIEDLKSYVSTCTPTNRYIYTYENFSSLPFYAELIFTPGDSDLNYRIYRNVLIQMPDCRYIDSPYTVIICVRKCLQYEDGDPCYDDNNYDQCIEYDWEEQTSENISALISASDEFPYDQGWTSILLSGTDTDKNVHSNWVIYKDLENDTGYFVVTDTGEIYPLGTYDRAFFLNFSTPSEVTNGW